MQANMTYGACDLPEAAAVQPASESVANESNFLHSSRKPVQSWGLLGVALLTILL